jgi:cell division protein ZapA
MTPVKVDILGKEFLVACPEEEKTELLQSAGYLNRKMREIRDSGRVIGLERIAVMAALNIAHELLRARAGSGAEQEVQRRLQAISAKLDAALEGERPAGE